MAKAVAFGGLSLLSYALVFVFQDRVMDYTTRGAGHAVLPVLGVLYFSLIHGAFASNLIALFGVEAAGRRREGGGDRQEPDSR